MKHWLFAFAGMAVLVLALTLSVGVPAAPPAHNALPAAAAPHNASGAAPLPEPHPEIHDAIEALRRAKAHMEHAAHDFGGHRVDAIRATDEAIRQLEICLKYDRD
jgi:hypothetical protein